MPEKKKFPPIETRAQVLLLYSKPVDGRQQNGIR